MHLFMHKHALACWFIVLAPVNLTFAAAPDSRSTAATNKTCPSEHSLATVRAGDLPALLGVPIGHITLWRVQDRQLVPIASQIDRRDDQGRYLLEQHSSDSKDRTQPLSGDDEIVFRLKDAGTQRPVIPPPSWPKIRAEIALDNPTGEQSRWVYASVTATHPVTTSTPDQVEYRAQTDTVLTDQYKITFNDERPFLIDDFSWHLTDKPGYSQNVLDSIKIQHIGTLFGFPFERTASDYSSELTQVKVGPLRIIRRTENRVRILWYLKTPTVYIDYIIMPDSFVMDTIIDIPFKLGLFFDRIETLTTIDWRDEPSLPALTISSPGAENELLVTGQMSVEKHAFNDVSETRFSVRSDFGTASVQLDIPDDFPIESWLYLNDNNSVPSPPEHQAGQFGNVGYRTTGWENIDTRVHHLKISACLSSGVSGHAP